MKMSDIIIHVGIHKTGSTWLQEYFFPKIRGIRYLYKERDYDAVERLVSLPRTKVLLSDEEISRSMPVRDNKLETLIELKTRFPDAKIIIGVRQFSPWFKSTYKQLVKTGSHMSFKTYENKYGDRPVPDWYANVVKMMWKDVFVYRFDDFVNNKDHVLKDMCDFIGVPVPDYEDKRVNASVKHVLFWRVINFLMCGMWLRKYIESPYFILTYPFRKLGLIFEESKRK